jgi:hypothetical protein
MGHDQVFKGILRRFFRDFLELFFPELAARLDFEYLEFPDKELFKGFPDGVSREPDVVARVRTREGKPETVVVHIEAQARTEADFGRRMFEYYALLWLSFDAPVFPIVLYVKEGGRVGIEARTYRHEVFGHEVMKFRYVSVALAQIAGEEYLERGPLAAALSALMRWSGDPDEVALRVRLLDRVVASGLDEASLFLLVNLIETYLPVPDEARERYRRLLAREEYRKVQEVELSWADRLRQEGVQEGLVLGKRQTLKRQLAAKFGGLPKRVDAAIDALATADELDACLDRVLTADSLEELGLSG